MSTQRSIRDVPSQDWTIEEALDWALRLGDHYTNDESERLIDGMRKDLEDAKRIAWELHRQNKQQQQQQGGEEDENRRPSPPQKQQPMSDANENTKTTNNGNLKPPPSSGMTEPSFADSEKTVLTQVILQPAAVAAPCVLTQKSASSSNIVVNAAAAAKPNTRTRKERNLKLPSLHVEILSGPYEAQSYHLRPTLKKPCMLGRSRGKKFTTNGISLPKDSELSTTHGKFEVFADQKTGILKLYFTDTGSSNGTVFQQKNDDQLYALEPHGPLELDSYTVLTCGQTVMKMHIVDH